VAKGLEIGDVHIEAWFYDVETGDVSSYRPDTASWRSIVETDD